MLFCNRLAEQARVRVGRDVAEMLPAGTALPEGGAAAHATLNLPGAQTAVTIVPWSKGRLYLLSPSDHAQLQPQALGRHRAEHPHAAVESVRRGSVAVPSP